MDPAGKAVFLSYASQDKEVAQRVCEALRAADVEVWFDLSELRGGDAWDALIRKRIKECTLFVPLITPNTNARAEGYFRLEWKLAVDRSHLMADDAPFLFPIVVGDVNDATARVPDKFREVQWTRLRLDETPQELAGRVARLLSGVAGVADPGPASARPATRRGAPARWQWWMIFPIIGTIMGLMFAAIPMWKALNRPVRREPPKVETPAVSPSTAAAPVRDWPKNPELKKAMNLTEGLETIPDDLTLAEEITKRVLDRSPTDIEAVTVMARVQAQYMRRGFDRSDERAALAKRYAERALQLAPDEPEAMYALATYHFSRVTGESVRTEQLLRRAMELDPTNPRPGRLLADLFNATNRSAEAIAQGRENIRRFPKDVLSHYDLARNYKDQGRYDEFDRELDATLALAPLPNAIVWKARLQFGLRNDFAGMKTWLDRVPARVRGTERAVFGYFIYAAFSGDPEAGLEALRDFPQKWFTDFEYAGPTALLNASLLELQGKKELARRQYEVAQGDIQRMRETDPARIGLNQVEFWTLLGLDRTEEAKASHRRVVEGSRRPYLHDMVNGWWFTVIPGSLLIGDRATALTLLRESVENRPESRAAFRLRFQIDPRMAPFRNDPELVAMLAEPKSPTATIAPKVDDKSVAVLAFANLSDDKANEYFSDGISEELLNVLAKVPGLKVSARTSAFYFKGKEVPIPEIAKQLGVAYVVEGSVRKQGDKVRITAQLIKAADGFPVWSDTFTRDLKDIFAVQDEIAGIIAGNLSLKMALGPARRAVNPEAHRLVLEGRHYWNLRTDDGLARAEAAFRSALALDPVFAEAHAGLANVLATVGAYRAYAGLVDSSPEAARQEAQRAIELAPALAEAYPALGQIYFMTGRPREAEQMYRKALELNPNYALPHHWYSIALEMEGRIDEALAEIERAIQLDPLSAIALVTRRRMLTEAGQPAAALAAYEREKAMVPDRPAAAGYRALCLLELGRRDEAVALARQVAAMPTMELRLWVDADIIHLLRQAGHEAEATEHATRILPRFTPDSYQRGAVLAALGRWDEAEPFLERAPVNVHNMFYWSPVWDAWRDDPRFRRLLAKLACEDAYRHARTTLSRKVSSLPKP